MEAKATEIRKALSTELGIPENKINWIYVRKHEDNAFSVRTGFCKLGNIKWNGNSHIFNEAEGLLGEFFKSLHYIGILNDCDKCIYKNDWLF